MQENMQGTNTTSIPTQIAATGEVNWRWTAPLYWGLALLLTVLLPALSATPVHAEKPEIGYLWQLEWDFENNFDGVMTVEVGPWENGELVDVYARSTTIIPCTRVGNVLLNGGDAVFSGAGHLECSMDLRQIVWDNHQLQISEVDDYGSILLRARVNSADNALSPIVSHPDAAYALDFSASHSVTMHQALRNGDVPTNAVFPGVTINAWHTYTFLYSCISNGGPCDANFLTGPQFQQQNTNGSRTQFQTGPTTFEIGRHGGNYFTGRMDAIIIDPGNSAH